MCRWMAWKGQPVILEELLFKPEHSLVVQSLHSDMGAETTNGDGFGVGWYGVGEGAGTYRSVEPAWNDANLRALAAHIESPLFLAHVRASTGSPVQETNCHPFAHGRWMFMHNGLIGNWSHVRRPIEALIPDELYPSRLGTTDSEAVFLAIMGAGGDRDPIGATERTLATVTSLVNANGAREPLRFTAALADGKDLYAFRYAANDNANTLYYRSDDGNVVIVSEPLDKDRSIWTPVPTNHMLVARLGQPVELLPFLAESRVAAE